MATRHPKKQAEQARRFVKAARALGCDEDETAFDDKLRAIARQKPKKESKKDEAPDH